MATQNNKRRGQGAHRPQENKLTLILLGLGIFQLIAALLTLVLWLASAPWQSYLIAIAILALVLTIPVVVFINNLRRTR